MAEGTKSATFGVSAVAYGEYSTSLGSESSANGEYDTSVGYGAQFSGGNSTSVGSNANASEMNTISIGSYSSASATDSVALGYGASATEENSVALGTNSTTSTVVSTATGTIAGTTYTYAGGTAYGTVSVGSEDGERTITNVAAGRVTADSTDAINGSQLYATNQAIESVSSDVDTLNTTVTNLSTDVTNLGTEVSNLSTKVNGFDGRINRLDNKVNKAVAGSAALAALHPLDFNPDDKWSFAVGYGNYNSANAMAVGAFYRPSEDTMISIGGAMGNGENIVNAGLSFKLGQSNGVSKSKVTMAREIVELSSDNRMMKDQIAALTDKVNALMGILDTSKKATFPDVPENHWAYEYVSTLAGNGILTGYPDGTFKGGQDMTRYELAAVFYRAMQNGAVNDATLQRGLKEFSPEISDIRNSRVRVDRISGEDHERGKVERVRINNNDTADVKYDVYGSII